MQSAGCALHWVRYCCKSCFRNTTDGKPAAAKLNSHETNESHSRRPPHYVRPPLRRFLLPLLPPPFFPSSPSRRRTLSLPPPSESRRSFLGSRFPTRSCLTAPGCRLLSPRTPPMPSPGFCFRPWVFWGLPALPPGRSLGLAGRSRAGPLGPAEKVASGSSPTCSRDASKEVTFRRKPICLLTNCGDSTSEASGTESAASAPLLLRRRRADRLTVLLHRKPKEQNEANPASSSAHVLPGRRQHCWYAAAQQSPTGRMESRELSKEKGPSCRMQLRQLLSCIPQLEFLVCRAAAQL